MQIHVLVPDSTLQCHYWLPKPTSEQNFHNIRPVIVIPKEICNMSNFQPHVLTQPQIFNGDLLTWLTLILSHTHTIQHPSGTAVLRTAALWGVRGVYWSCSAHSSIPEPVLACPKPHSLQASSLPYCSIVGDLRLFQQMELNEIHRTGCLNRDCTLEILSGN